MKTQVGRLQQQTFSGWSWGHLGWALLFLSLGGLGGWLLGSQGRPGQGGAALEVAGRVGGTGSLEATEAAPLTTLEVKPREISQERILVGSLEAVERTPLSSRIVGRVVELPVQEGQRVAAGSLIARLDISDVQAAQQQAQAQRQQAEAQLQQAQAGLLAAQAGVRGAEEALRQVQAQKQQAEAELQEARLHQERMQKLHAEGAVAQAQVDQANTRVAVLLGRLAQLEAGIQQAEQGLTQARAQLAQAESRIPEVQAAMAQAQAGVAQTQANLAYGTLVAPFAGVVTRKYVEVGALAGPGQPIVELESSERLRFSVALPESLAGQIRVGQAVPISIDSLNQTVEGTIRQIIPSADPSSRTVEVKVEIPPLPGAMPGMLGRLKLAGETRQALLLPQASLVEQFGLTGVYRLVDGKPLFTPVVVGSRYGDQVEIHSGLQPGDEVIQEAAAVRARSF
ncbi:efflux RND transporter periplasmic adaptor subunit [Synechococcus sp. H60.3]|uniref:efflux RND transporter periplasmic adaptor subunit n=2 Tax=Synechococcus TaxID=1129 RepID=UPI0039C0333D